MTKTIGKHRAERNLTERVEVFLQLLSVALTCAVSLFNLVVDIIKAVHGGLW